MQEPNSFVNHTVFVSLETDAYSLLPSLVVNKLLSIARTDFIFSDLIDQLWPIDDARKVRSVGSPVNSASVARIIFSCIDETQGTDRLNGAVLFYCCHLQVLTSR